MPIPLARVRGGRAHPMNDRFRALRALSVPGPAVVWLPLLFSLAALASLGCSQNVEEVRDGAAPPGPPTLNAQLGRATGEELEREMLERGTPPGVTGEIRLAPELADKVGPDAVLFVFARQPGGGPIAVKRLGHPTFPLRFFLGQESVMFQGQELTGEIDLQARVSQTGAAGPPEPGDLEGFGVENPVTVGDNEVHQLILDIEH